MSILGLVGHVHPWNLAAALSVHVLVWSRTVWRRAFCHSQFSWNFREKRKSVSEDPQPDGDIYIQKLITRLTVRTCGGIVCVLFLLLILVFVSAHRHVPRAAQVLMCLALGFDVSVCV
jgi:hypothetical protein